MYENITLSELIRELQSIEAEHGDRAVLAVGTCSGQFGPMRNPFSLRLSGEDIEGVCVLIAAHKEDIGKSYVRN